MNKNVYFQHTKLHSLALFIGQVSGLNTNINVTSSRVLLLIYLHRDTLSPRLKCVYVCVCVCVCVPVQHALKLTIKLHFELRARPNNQIHTKYVKAAGLGIIHLNTVHVLK